MLFISCFYTYDFMIFQCQLLIKFGHFSCLEFETNISESNLCVVVHIFEYLVDIIDIAQPNFSWNDNDLLWKCSTAELVEGVLQGRNGSVFCYGATGAGKTYTMLGTVENPGVMVLAIKDLFSKIRQRSYDGNHLVHLSYLEVYNETVRDLLSPGRPLVLREDKQVFTWS